MARERQHSDLSGNVDWGASVGLDAERQFLGLLMARADVFDQVAGDVRGAQFYEPLHRQIFDLVHAHRTKGQAITRERLEGLLANDAAFKGQGGARYLDAIEAAASLAEIEGTDARELGRLVADLYLRREVITACRDIAIGARSDGLTSGRDLRDMLERRLLAADFQGQDESLKTMAQMGALAIEDAKRKGAGLLSTGFRKLDERLGRQERGDLILLGARPSMGKTALASCWALNMAHERIGVIEFNGEMSEGQVARRHIADQCFRMWDVRGPTYRDIRAGNLKPQQTAMIAEAQRELDALPLSGMRKRALTVAQLRTLAIRQTRLWADQGIRLGLIVVDSINNMDAALPGNTTPVQQMTALSRGLKSVAIDLDCVVLALSQLSRDIERRDDKRPILSDLRESGSLEQDADVVIGIYRDAYYAEREPAPKKNEDRMEWEDRKGSSTVEAIALKVKEGPPGTDKLWGDVARNAIRDEIPNFTDRAAPNEFDFNPAEDVPL